MEEDNFPWFDREETLKLLLKRVENLRAGYRQNLALLGPEGIGKTTLLKHLLQERLSTPSSCGVFYVDLRQEDTFVDWVERFVQALLGEALQVKSSQELPRTRALAQRLLALAENGSADLSADALMAEEVYGQLWDLPHLMTQETGMPNILVVDEFQRLRFLGLKDPFRRLGGKIMVQGNTLYLLVSSEVELARQILGEGLSLLFGQFEVVEVSPLEPEICLKAIRQRCGESSANEFVTQLVIELAQGYPGKLHLLMKGLLTSHAHADAEEVFLDWLESLFLEPDGILRNRFEDRLRRLQPQHDRYSPERAAGSGAASLSRSRDRRIWIQVLGAVAGGARQLTQIVQAVGRPRPQVSAAVRVLVQERRVMVKEGVFYRISDRLFELWIRTAQPILQRGGFLDLETRRSFRAAASVWMNEIHQALHRPLEEHALRLIRQWGGEAVEIDGKSLKLPSFDRIEMIQGPMGYRVIVAHRIQKSGKGWIVVPVKGALEESQARSWVTAFRESPFAHYRKVFMGAYPVEMNARLILQEAAIGLWDLPIMNHLLDLYGMPRLPFLKSAVSSLAETIPIAASAADSVRSHILS